METNSGVTMIGAEAPRAYQMAPRIENANQIGGGGGGGSAAVDVSPVSVGLTGSTIEKKKRGRPRKYGLDGTMSRALSPMPISASVSPGGVEFSSSGGKRGTGRGSGYQIKHQKGMNMENLGEWAATSVGTNFTPHVITVNTGEDVTMKVISFSQQGPRAICILSANGVISNVTLRQRDSSGGTLTYELRGNTTFDLKSCANCDAKPSLSNQWLIYMRGRKGRFEILSLSGSFMPTETQGTRSRSGGMSVSLASADGRVVGGVVDGLLIAAGPVQVVVGSFLPGNQHGQIQKPKKHKNDSILATVSPNSSTVAAPTSNAEKEDVMDVVSPQQNSNALKPNHITASFQRENWAAAMQEPRNSATDMNISLPAR